jgi:hypothetical protein
MANSMRTSTLLLCLARQSIHDYYQFPMEDGGRLASMAAELVDRLAILVAARRFPGMGAANSRSLRSDNYVRMQHFVRRTTSFPFRRFLGDVRREFMQRLSAALYGAPISAMLCRRAVLTSFLFLELRFFPLFFFFALWPPMVFSFKIIFQLNECLPQFCRMTLKYGYKYLYRTRHNSAIDTRTPKPNPDDLNTSDCHTKSGHKSPVKATRSQKVATTLCS